MIVLQAGHCSQDYLAVVILVCGERQYYLYIIVQEYTTVSNSGLCTGGHNAIGGYCTLQNVLETRSRLSIVIQDNSPLGNKRNVPKENNKERTIRCPNKEGQ